MDITTDGSITPEQAMKMSAEIMVEHFKFVAESEIVGTDMPVVAGEAETIAVEGEEKPKKTRKKKAEPEAEAAE